MENQGGLFEFPGNIEPTSEVLRRIKRASEEIVTPKNIEEMRRIVSGKKPLRVAAAQILDRVASNVDVG